eukprot:5863617-Pleurochrysis_carterae.AAC.6
MVRAAMICVSRCAERASTVASVASAPYWAPPTPPGELQAARRAHLSVGLALGERRVSTAPIRALAASNSRSSTGEPDAARAMRHARTSYAAAKTGIGIVN